MLRDDGSGCPHSVRLQPTSPASSSALGCALHVGPPAPLRLLLRVAACPTKQHRPLPHAADGVNTTITVDAPAFSKGEGVQRLRLIFPSFSELVYDPVRSVSLQRCGREDTARLFGSMVRHACSFCLLFALLSSLTGLDVSP